MSTAEQLMPGEEITNAKTEHSKRHDDEEHSVRKTQGPKKKVRMAHQVELGMLTKRKIGRPKSPKKQWELVNKCLSDFWDRLVGILQ